MLSDVTILLPTRTSLPFLRSALERRDLPYRLATGTLVYDTQEVRDALSALHAIDDSTDELSLVAALRSPLYGCSDVDLFTFREAGGRWSVRRPTPESLGGDHPVVAAIAHLHSLWLDRWWLSPSAMLERLLRERRAFLLAFGDPRPAEVWRRLRFLADQARAFEEAEGGDLRGFLEWAALQGEEGSRVHEPLLPETDDAAIQILTVHGAKGLEFPITVLSGMTTKPGTQGRMGASLVFDEGRPEVRLRKGIETENHDPRADIEREMDVHEKVRLLYVGATRARDHLVVSCHHQANGKFETYAGQLYGFFADRDDLWRPFEPDESADTGDTVADAAAPEVPAVEVPADDREAWIAEREALLAPHREATVVSATTVAYLANEAAAALAVDAAAEDLDEDTDLLDQDPPSPTPMHHRGRAGTAVGRAVHATLEVLDFADPQQVEAQVTRQCELESIPELVETAVALVRSALASDAVRLAAARPHHRELFVAAPVGHKVIEGYVDLLIEGPDGLIVVDYKTDSANSEAEIDAKLAAYELQGASYAVVLEAVTGQKVVDCRFVFCKASGAIERSVADLPAAMTRVRESLTRSC